MRQAIVAAVGRLAVIPFFPTDENARLEVMYALEDMIGTETLYGSTPQQRLDWLIKVAVNAMRQWGGIPELRGLLCSKWRPADGIEAYSSLPGYSPGDSESLAIAEHRNHKAIEAGRTSPRLLEAAEAPMNPDELRQFHDDLLKPLLRRSQPPRETLAQLEQQIAAAPRKPPLTEEEKARRVREIEEALKQRKE